MFYIVALTRKSSKQTMALGMGCGRLRPLGKPVFSPFVFLPLPTAVPWPLNAGRSCGYFMTERNPKTSSSVSVLTSGTARQRPSSCIREILGVDGCRAW
ncbi:hypothetical protein PoB_003691200 [Plakobranchus ocellatus]|uniref:Uncharacterized protein n=1 Tax=Plakobranchus ocellatus TaxID=259542 RepID=A0AAV4ATV1_9GAST|nr:hypothetical protein PoB_003691200 [Plakobranchus ocellatus]